jgi:hypothetical protein
VLLLFSCSALIALFFFKWIEMGDSCPVLALLDRVDIAVAVEMTGKGAISSLACEDDS